MTAKYLDLMRERCPGLMAESVTVLEIGSRDAVQSLELAAALPYANIFAFEPNPDTIPLALKNTILSPRVRVIGAAVTKVDGEIDFYSSLTGNNPGCSSVFPASGKYDCVERMPAKKIRVPSVRLDTWLHAYRDLQPPTFLWCDCQGSELNALDSLGEYLENVKAVWAEVLYDSLYSGQCYRDDLVNFLDGRGLKLVYEAPGFHDQKGKRWWGDCAFFRP